MAAAAKREYLIINVSQQYGENPVSTSRGLIRYHSDIGMIDKIGRILIIVKSGKHGSVVHVVPVNDSERRVQPARAPYIHERRTRGVPFPAKSAIHIVFVILPLNYRIVNLCVIDFKPEDIRRIDLAKIYSRANFSLHITRIHRRDDNRRYPPKLVVFFLRRLVAGINTVEVHERDSARANQYYKKDGE